MVIALLEAARLARVNRGKAEELEDRHAAVTSRLAREQDAQEKKRREIYDDVLVPFREVFSRLKNVDLAELANIDLPAVPSNSIEVAQVRLTALHAVGALAGGLGAGAGAGLTALAGVGALAAASTGTSISALSGAAATSATLAWLGGGSLAAGGGGVAAGSIVLGGLMTAPLFVVGVGVVSWQGRRQRRRQRTTGAKLDDSDREMTRVENDTRAVLSRSRQVRELLTEVQAEADSSLVRLREVVDACDDYACCTTEQRSRVAVAVGLVTTSVSVMSTPLTGEDGTVTDLSEHVVRDARARLADLRSEQASTTSMQADADAGSGFFA